jgi:hypothetical protein
VRGRTPFATDAELRDLAAGRIPCPGDCYCEGGSCTLRAAQIAAELARREMRRREKNRETILERNRRHRAKRRAEADQCRV